MNVHGSMPQKKFSLLTIQLLCMLYVVVWSTSPPLQLDSIYRVVALGCVVLWFIIAVSKDLRLDKNQIYSIFLLFAVIIVTAVESLSSSISLFSPISHYMFILLAICASYYQGREESLNAIVLIVFAACVIWNIVTYRELIVNPGIARLIVRNDPAIYSYMRRGVGGYGLVYSQVLIVAPAILWIINKFKRKKKLQYTIGIVWLASLVLLVFEAGYTIAVILLAVIPFMVLFNKSYSAMKAIIIFLVLTIGIAVAVMYIHPFRNFLLDIFEGNKVASKINDFVSTVETDVTADSFNSRYVRYRASVVTFFKYPLTGGLWWAGGGGHSALMDMFSKYGIFGGIVYSKIIFSGILKKKKLLNSQYEISIINAAIVIVVFVLLLDSAPYQFAAPVVLLIPILLIGNCEMKQETGQKKQNRS